MQIGSQYAPLVCDSFPKAYQRFCPKYWSRLLAMLQGVAGRIRMGRNGKATNNLTAKTSGEAETGSASSRSLPLEL